MVLTKSRLSDPGLIAGQLYVVLTDAMTKQDIQEYYGQSIYQIQMNVAKRSSRWFATSQSKRPSLRWLS